MARTRSRSQTFARATPKDLAMAFRIRGLSPEPFRHLFGLDDAALAAHGARRCRVDKTPGFPDRVELRDLDPGEHALLLNYVHQPADNPYRSAHAIFVVEGAIERYDRVDEIPEVIRVRPISLRAFGADDCMVDAELADGSELRPLIEHFLARQDVAYLHAHYARRGCFGARIDRA